MDFRSLIQRLTKLRLPGFSATSSKSARWKALEPPTSDHLLVGGLMLTSFLLRLWIASKQELFQDEALYFFIGQRLPWTFSPHPPGTPLLAYLGSVLLGRHEFAIRFMNLVFLTATIPLIFMLGRELGSLRIARWATIAFVLTPFYFAIGTICTPDAPQLFFWALAMYWLWRATNSKSRPSFIAAGVALGLGLYFKYILILVLPSYALFLLLSGKWKQALRDRDLWSFLAIAALLFLPFALWSEAREGWPALRYHLQDRQTFVLPTLNNIGEYLGVHLLYYSPLLYLAAVAGALYCGWVGLRNANRKWLFLSSFFVVPWLFFLLIAAFTRRILSREQWDAPAYIAGLIAAAILFDRVLSALPPSPIRRRVQELGIAAVALGGLLIAGAAAESVAELPSHLLGRPPFFSSMAGWRTMARAADRHLEEEMATGASPYLLGNSFLPVLQYAFYGKYSPKLFTLNHSQNRKYGLTHFLDRAGLSARHLASVGQAPALFVAESDDFDETSQRLIELEQKLKNHFAEVTPLPPAEERDGNRILKQFLFFRCRGLLTSPNRTASPPSGNATP
ncbi:MAG: phospholipid carrier-dependent glycosyltransferase [Candidatus Hydrogenedentota bacterium]|jgi:hypothetical protein|nr:MAG: phospholipid carrier-dependent glycosyltransferase [Candidatus Hydrogenedentota bacterium]